MENKVEHSVIKNIKPSSSELILYKNAESVLQEHLKSNTRHIIYRNEVFNAGKYLDEKGHPGGDNVVKDFYGKDVTIKMHELNHSKTAYKLLRNYLVGVVEDKVEYSIDKNSDGSQALLEAHSLISQEMADKIAKRFDLNEPLFPQILDKTLTREEYLAFIKEPKIYSDPNKQVRIFKSDFCEFFSSTPWYAIPMLYLPIACVVLYFQLSYLREDYSFLRAIVLVVLGLFEWTFTEYILHRFIFHFEENLPVYPWVFGIHFLTHGIHHAFPEDPGRLVFPIFLGVIVGSLKFFLNSQLYPLDDAVFLMEGWGMGYICYDMIHYYVHHAGSFNFFQYMKIYHQKHHHKDPDNGFGVSSPLWDLVFGTFLN